MEQEVNITKRKKCKKGKPIAPEKLFLQFDPSKKEDLCSSKKMGNAQPFLMQKTPWKPPIKVLSPPESFDPCKIIHQENEGENVCSGSNVNTANLSFSNGDNYKAIDNCLVEVGGHVEEDEENSDVIIVNSSSDSSEQNSPEIESNDRGHNCSHHEDPSEITRNIVLFDKNPKTLIHEGEEITDIKSYQKDMLVEKGCLQLLSSEVNNCNSEVENPIAPHINSNNCQDLDDIMSQGDNRNDMENILKLSDKNNLNESNNTLSEQKLSLKEDFFQKELNSHIFHPNDINPQPTQPSVILKSHFVDTKHVKSEMIVCENKSDELKIIDISNDLNNKRVDTDHKKEIVVEKSNIKIKEENSRNTLNQTQNREITKLQNSTTDMADNTERSDKSEIITENTVSTSNMLCTTESSNSNHSKIQCISEISEIGAILIDSVFENESPTAIENSPKVEVEIEKNEDILSLNVLYDVPGPENAFITTNLVSDVHSAPDTNNRSILLIDNYNDNSPYQNSVNHNSEINDKDRNEHLESDSKDEEENETNLTIGDKPLSKDCSIQNDDSLETSINEVNEGEKGNGGDTSEFEQLLELENNIQKEKVEMDEEYSCLMISNSQLAEIEKNYYESSQHRVENEVPKELENKHMQFNLERPKENNTDYNCSNAEGKCESVNVSDPPTNYGVQNSSDSITPQQLPSVQWSKKMKEMKMKFRNILGEIEQLNSLLMGFRRELWPQKHGHNPGDASSR